MPMIESMCHLCIDMQRQFAEDTPWRVPWMQKVSPQICEIVSRHAERTVFTRFIPPATPVGMWRPYYEKWWMMTREHQPPEMFDILPQLAHFAPPASVFDKTTYSPWVDGRLHRLLQRGGVEAIAITGGETDVCVLATVLGGIDLGYRVILLSDAVCSGADETHDASMKLLGDRFSVQLEVTTTEKFLSHVG
jgi:nicotinamidase-related amidase